MKCRYQLNITIYNTKPGENHAKWLVRKTNKGRKGVSFDKSRSLLWDPKSLSQQTGWEHKQKLILTMN